jgi:hypothetical protein
LKRYDFVIQAAHLRALLGPKLAPSHQGGGWVWGTRRLRSAPVCTDHVRSRRG